MIDGIVWPIVIPSSPRAMIRSLLDQFEDTQYLAPVELQRLQRLQLEKLVAHARQAPIYKTVSVDLTSNRILTRQDLQVNRPDLQPPAQHGAWALATTSGSTGQPVNVNRTELLQLFLSALVMRDHLWHRRDFSESMVVIKANTPRMSFRSWGPPVNLFYKTGALDSFPLSVSVDEQLSWLLKHRPSYLLTYPTNLTALLDVGGLRFRGVQTMGETVPPELSSRCQQIFGAPLADCYSSQEVGTIALQCPTSGLYHVQSESLIVEVLRDDDTTCDVGETGRVVITDLHNFVTPLIRYDIRDFATVGPVCSCGRTLPTLSRIVGRRRNMITLPDGSKHWPIVGLHRFEETGIGVRQYQVTQTSLNKIKVSLVADRPNADQERALVRIIQQALGHEFDVTFHYVDHEIVSPAGKYEEFVSLV